MKDPNLLKNMPIEILDSKIVEYCLRKYMGEGQDRLDLLFAFASPFSNPSDTRKPPAPIGFREEYDTIDTTLKKIKRNISYMKMLATEQNLSGAFSKNPKILHFSGHGMKDDKITGEDYLLIENAFLEGAKLTTTEITKIMKANKNSEVEVVVVMS